MPDEERGEGQGTGRGPERSRPRLRSIIRSSASSTTKRRATARWACCRNVFLHLHPAKINRDAVRYNYTWGMGGITFYFFIVLTFTGVLLMFYYHPTKVQAFRDILYLENDVPFGKLLRNMHRWAAHLMVITVWLHMFRVFLTGSYKKPREFNWCVGVLLLVLTLLLCSPDICCRTINSASGRSPWERTWRARRRCWATKARSARSWA